VLDRQAGDGHSNRPQPVGNPGNPFVATHCRKPECNGFVESCGRDLGRMAHALQVGYGNPAAFDCQKEWQFTTFAFSSLSCDNGNNGNHARWWRSR
jgi:hypothetical protein